MTCSSRTKTVAAFLCVAMVALGTGQALAQKTKPKFQIKFATLAPDGSTWMNTMHAIDKEVRQKTENRLGFKFYAGGVQGDEKDVLRKIRVGQIHAGGFTGYGLGAVVSEVRVQELPFMFESLDELDYLREQTDAYFEQQFAEAGFVFLGWADVGFVYLMSKSAIHTPEELTHARMWVWSGDPLAELFFKAFEISPIPLSAADVLTSLQTGVINAVYASPLACVALQWFTRVSHMTNVPLSHGLGAVLVAKSKLRGVSDEDLSLLKEIARPHLRSLTLKTREQNVEALDEMKKEGVQVVSIDDATRREFFARGRGAWSDGVGELYPQELLDRVTRTLTEYRDGSAQQQ